MLPACLLLLVLALFPSADSERVLLVLVDGVRWDYLRNGSFPGFERIAANGVRAEYVTPVFPSNSYPNWYTIVTGLYPESHGLLQNYMYDARLDDLFLMALHSNASHPHWWEGAEPLWVTAEARDLRTALYWWDGCQVAIRGRRASACEEYANYWVWGKVNRDTLAAAEELLDKFARDDFRLGMLYYEAVDATGHFRGPDSEDRVNALKDIDTILNSVQDQIARRGMEHQVNLIVVSDHGMIGVDPNSTRVIDIEEHVDIRDIRLMLDRGAVSMVLPATGKLEKLYNDLKGAKIEGLTVYKKDEIPDHYHFKKHRLVQPLLLVAQQGYVIKALSDPRRMKPFAERIFKGYHGYDPYTVKDMRTIFYARGPSFKRGFVSPPLEMVDHYEAICRAMGMEPLPNNGSWARTGPMLTGNALKTDTHVGTDKKAKVAPTYTKKAANKKGVFKGKRKNVLSSAPHCRLALAVLLLSLLASSLANTARRPL